MTPIPTRLGRRHPQLIRAARFAGAVVLLGTLFETLGPAPSAQAPASAASGPASTPALPDWSGAWIRPFEPFVTENARLRNPVDPTAPRLAPPYAALMDETRRGLTNGGGGTSRVSPDAGPRRRLNSEDCLPTGMPNMMRYAFAFEFLFTAGRVTLVLEHDDTSVRRIYTDGRTHAADPDPSFNGESIGHWEGQTLVVHTTAISPKAELIAGVPTSGHATVTERIHLVDRDHLEIETIVEDPVALLAPWRSTRVYDRTAPVFFERICQENNRESASDRPESDAAEVIRRDAVRVRLRFDGSADAGRTCVSAW